MTPKQREESPAGDGPLPAAVPLEQPETYPRNDPEPAALAHDGPSLSLSAWLVDLRWPRSPSAGSVPYDIQTTGFATSRTARTPPAPVRGLQLARGAEDQLRERGAAGCRHGSWLGGWMPLTLDVGRSCWRLHSRAWEACGDVGGVVPKDDGMEGCRRRMMDDGSIVQASDCRVPNRRAEQYRHYPLGHPPRLVAPRTR